MMKGEQDETRMKQVSMRLRMTKSDEMELRGVERSDGDGADKEAESLCDEWLRRVSER